MAYYNCSLMSDSEIQEKYPNLLKDGYTPADIRTEITAWQDKQRKTLGESYKYDSVPLEKEIYNRIEEKELAYYNSPAYEKELQDILDKAPRDKEGHLLAPNGKPTNLTERQYAQVRTKSFKRWFGDWINNPETASKVVDENGEPLVVYSGRKKNEFEFKNRLKGFYATNSKYIADTYAKNYNGATYEIFLNIKNPYKINDSTRIKLLNEEEQYAYRKWQMLWDDKDVEGFLGEHDGGIYNGGSEYLVINSNQIKSATDNIGTFSTEDANIYKHLLYKDIISEKDYIDFLTEFELNRDKTDDFLYNFITKILQVNPRNKRDKSIPLTVQNYPTSNKVFINYKSERAIINRILGLSADFSFDSETFEKDLKDYIENKWEKDLYEELIRLDKELLSNLNHLYKERAKVQNNISLLQVYLNHREQSPKEVLEYVESFKSTKRKTTSLSQHIGYELKKKKSELAILDEKIKHYRFSNASRTLKVKNRLAALYNIDNVKELVFNRIKADRDSYKLPKEEWEKKIAPYMSLYEKAKKASKNAELLEYNNPIFENKKSLDEISVNELYNKLIQLNPKMKSFLEFIKLVNPKLKIKVYNTEDYNNLAEREDSYISGQSASIFFPRKNEVAFRLNADTSTILHELLHSVSSYGLIGSSEEQKALGKNVIQPFIDYIDNYLKQNVGNFGSYSIFGAKMPATIYGLTNPAEFIAELFSNKDFQELLDAIPPMEKKQYSSLLEEIIDSILNFVKNIFAPKTNETALDQAIQLSLAVIRTQYENIDEIYEQLSNIEDTAQKQILDKQEAKQWNRYSVNNYEVSSEGDGRFSAKNATFKKGTIIEGVDVGGKTIEYVYQSIIKKSRKGQPPSADSITNLDRIEENGEPSWIKENLGERLPKDLWHKLYGIYVGLADSDIEITDADKEDFSYYVGYLPLWQEWAKQNPELLEELREKSKGKVLTDKFANTRVSQARALADILNATSKDSRLYRPLVNSYTGNITPDADTIFVFGSNPEGRHGAGAAKIAREQFGAIYGQGEGLQGNAYALPTKRIKSITPTKTGQMTFSYGTNKRSDVKSNTTLEAIINGERTATTRYSTDGHIDYWKDLKVGDIVAFTSADRKTTVYVKITKPLTKLDSSTNAEEWSKREGWSVEYYNSKVKPKVEKGQAYQMEYEFVDANGERTITPLQIIENIKKLYETARQNPDKQFKVAYRNTDKASLNGYTGLEMIDMFLKAGPIPSNIYFSKEWIDTGKFNLSAYTLNSTQENSQFNTTNITKIISGGQTGVDTIGLQVAKELGIETGGTAPKGFLRETGIDNEDISSYNLVEITDEEQADYTKRKNKKDPYTGRTELNVRNSDGTVYFYTSDDKIGMLATQRSAKEWNKPFIVNPSVEQLRDWIIENNIKVLNVAGNRGSKLSKDNNVAKVLRKALTYSKASEDSTIEEPQQIPVYQTPTLEEDTKINAAFPNTSIRRDRVNLIKRLIYKGLSKEYDRQLAELEQRILDANNIEGEEERQKVISELESSKNSLTEDKAIELGIGNVIKEVKETLNPDNPSNSKEAERARLMKIEGFRKLDSEKQEQIVENNYQKKNKAYRIIQDNWNSLIDEVLPLINDEYGLKIDKSSEPDIDEDAGRDMYQVKARNEDMRSSLSKEIKKLISNVRWIRPDGKILKDDLGFAKYLNSDYVHISLLESLSKARSCMDFWNIFENLALKKPWVNELKKELDKNESLKSKFYQDFRKEFIPYWIEYEYETNKKTGQKKRVTKRVNKTAFLYNTLDSWKDNLEGGTILNDFHIFNEDRSINNDNIEKVLKVVTDLTSKYQEAHNNSLTSGRQEVIDFISDNLPRIKTVIESLGLEVDSDSLNETLNEKDANISEILSVTSEMLNKLKKGILDGKDINNNPIQLDFFDTLGGYATRLAKAINTIDKDSVLKSFRESGKSYQSYTVPSYFGKVIENLKNGSAEDIRQYLMNNYGKYEWFYDHNTNQWRNEWLRAIYENPDKYKNIIERKVVLHSDKKDFNDWGDKQYALSMLTEFGLEDKSKKTAYYYLPVLADAESAEFIQFERFIGSDDKFKSDIRKKLSSVVWQEYYRIQLVKQRKKEGATPIDNFDKRGEKFCFIPELNTLKDNNGKLFIDSLTSYIINGESLEADTLIDYALDKILTDGFTDFYNKLNETGVLAQTKDNKNVFFGYSAEDMNNALVNFYYNNALAQTQIIELLTTDLAFYKSLNDFQKRFKEVYVMNRKLNTTSKYGRKFEKTVILKDLKIKAPSYDTIKEILDKAVEDKRISTSTRDRILGLYADGKVNVTDAQAFRSLSSYKAVLDMAGRWTNEMDEAMDRMKDGSFSDEDFETIFQTIKPFVYTQTTKSTGVKITKDFGEYLKTPMQCKNSEFLLINALNTMVFALSNSGKLKAIEQFMEDYNVDVVQFESAVKCGGQGKLDLSTLSDSDYNGVYDYLKKTTGFNVDSENGNSDYVTIIDYEDYGIQTENPEHLLDTQALFGTQIRKLIFEDMPNDTKFTIGNKEFTKEELWGLYNKLLSSNVFLSYKEIEKEFGSIEGVAKIVQKQVKENPLMYSEELRKACELVEVKDEKTGEVHKEFNLPIYDPVQRNRIEALLLSVIKNTVVKQKIKGASCVQVSCFGTTDSLHIERTEDGGIKYIECYLPAYSKKFFQSFFKKDKDGKPYLDINELPEDLRRCIGYRIPTEGHYSMQPLYIKGFLPVQNGSMIMLPAEITQLTGSDFDIDKVFLMLPEFNIGDYIKKEKLKKDFKKYLEENKPDLYKKYISEYTLRDRELKSFDKKAFENDFDITLKQIIHNTDEESALRLPQNFSEDTFEMELFDFLNDNKNKYSSKLSKVKYDFNKSFEENLDDKDPKEARRRINNALMDIMYGILTSKEAAPKILDGGNFDLAKKGDRICQIADNLKGENISTLADELEVEHSYKAVLDKLESMNVKQLNKILEDIQGELSPITPTTNLYFHSQNANGGKMIGVYANNSVANAMFQMANITLVENEKTGIMPVIFGGKEFKKFGNFYDMNGNPISRNIKNFLAASVDNVKDPVLKGLMQNPVTGSITCMLINLGIDIDSVGLFLNQPMIKEVISIMEDDREVSCETAVNRVLKNHNLLSIEVEDKIYQNYSNLMKEDLFKNIINESDVADIVFLDKFKEYMDKADNYRKIVSILRGDTSKGSIESTIAGCLKRINDFLFLYKKNPHFHIGNLLILLTKKEDFDNFEDYYKNIENSSIPFISSFTSSGILATESLLKPYTPFFNSSITSILFDDNYGITSLYTKDVIPENVFESVMNDWFLFVLNKGEFFNSTKTENITRYDAEDRDYFINKFPEDFKKLKETIPELKDNQFIKKIIPVYPERKNKNGKRSKGYFPFTRLKFQNSGSLSQLQIDNYSRDWLSLLSSNDIRLNKLGRALFKYATYFGFGFSPESFIRMASVNARKSIPDYVETIKNIDNFNDELKNSLFVFQYLLNHTNDDNLVPNIEIDTRNISNSVVTFSPENVKLFDKVVVNHFKNGDNYYQVVRPVIKVTINGETKVYSTSKVVTPMGEEVHYYETIPLGYKGKVFEYQYNSVPSSVINKTSSIDNSEIESSEEDDWGDNGFTASDERSSNIKNNNIPQQKSPDSLKDIDCNPIGDVDGKVACVI